MQSLVEPAGSVPDQPTGLKNEASSTPKEFSALLARAASDDPSAYAVIEAADQGVLEAVRLYEEASGVSPFLVGNLAHIEVAARAVGLSLVGLKIVHTDSPEASVEAAVDLVCKGEVKCLQKGQISTDILMRGLLSKSRGVSSGKTFSHILYVLSDRMVRPVLISDAGVIPNPDIETKKLLVNRAVAVAHAVGISRPRIAVLSASEKISESVRSSVEADALTDWWRCEGKGADLFGPLSLDLSLSREAATKKGLDGKVLGQADVLIAPNIEAANAIYKSMTYFADAIGAGVVLGADVPVLLTSRSDPPLSRIASLALANCILKYEGNSE